MNKILGFSIAGIIVLTAIAVAAYVVSPQVKYATFTKAPFFANVAATLSGSDVDQDRYNLAYHYFNPVSFERDLPRAAVLLEMTPNDKESQYLLARTYFGLQDTAEVVRVLDTYIEMYPEEKRAHYVRGLAGAYQEQWEQAEADFKEFIAFIFRILC